MREQFPGYYALDDQALQEIWQNATVILDTNVLLNFYSLPKLAQEQFFSLLETLRNRIWIPYQVGLEFQRRRLEVIHRYQKNIQNLRDKPKSILNDLANSIKSLELDKMDLNSSSSQLIEKLEDAIDLISKTLDKVHESASKVSHDDPIRDRIDSIIGEVGPKPADQNAVEELICDAERRYELKVPPGYMDIDKDQNP